MKDFDRTGFSLLHFRSHGKPQATQAEACATDVPENNGISKFLLRGRWDRTGGSI
jgi:hypothetical protein